MAFDKSDARAIIILVLFIFFGAIARAYAQVTIMYVLVILFLILLVMYVNKLYHREIKKDYFSRYDKIDVPDNEED
jgi:uncharacterized membrane protein YwaF